jgi:hypothetical protein
MAPEGMAVILCALNKPCYFVSFFALFVTYFVHNVAATVSYDRKELLDIRTAITYLELDKSFFFTESDERDLLQTPEQALIPVIRRRKRRRYCGRRLGYLVRIWR